MRYLSIPPRLVQSCALTLLLSACSVFQSNESVIGDGSARLGSILEAPTVLADAELPSRDAVSQGVNTEPASNAASSDVSISDPDSGVADLTGDPSTSGADFEISRAQVIQNYERLLLLSEDPQTQLTILQRLADLKLSRGEELMVDQAVDELDIAIGAYNNLLQTYPNQPGNDEIYYQLAKSYSLQGKSDEYLESLSVLVTQFPQSVYFAEAQFRRGDALFTLGRYRDAQDAFQAAIDVGETPYLVNAHYMRGWSLFKQERYETALLAYLYVLDILEPKVALTDDIEKPRSTLLEDMFRVMGLSFNYLGGADALEELFDLAGPRNYEPLIYSRYAKLLLEKEQFSDALAVYERYIALHPTSLWSPRYQIQIIDTLRKAGFIADIFDEKVLFVDEYGFGTEFWFENRHEDLSYVNAQLERLIPELAKRHYVLAQRADKRLKNEKNTEERIVLESDRVLNYSKAARYFQSFVETFPDHPETPHTLFLLGESLFATKEWLPAISAYESAGYDYLSRDGQTYDQANEAAYAAIITYEAYAKEWSDLPPDLVAENRLLQQMNRLRFVDIHGDDVRASGVLYQALQFAYDENDFEHSIELADRLLSWIPVPEQAITQEALILRAHSLYALQDYLLAEQAYVTAIAALTEKDVRRSVLWENLAASIYQQAEQRIAAGDLEGAVDELLRVGEVVPSSSLRANAEYDAISFLVDLKQWPRMIEETRKFRQRYPKHELIDTLVAKMALAYRETEQWELAADELKKLIALAKTEDEKRDTLFIAAELYDKAGNWDKAIKNYRSYANTYQEPADVYMEAANRLAELYEETDVPLKRRFWLAKQMKKVDALGNRADDRMRFLAASAAAVLANDAFVQYKRIKLTLPLQQTMIKKTEALEAAMKAYQKTASYGISKFSTEAGYRMADIYAQLSRDLMDSDRPPGLNALELEQYEILLEEQAFPFEDSAIEIHEQNASRSWSGIYDDWVKKSFSSLKELLPGRYDKPETREGLLNVFE